MPSGFFTGAKVQNTFEAVVCVDAYTWAFFSIFAPRQVGAPTPKINFFPSAILAAFMRGPQQIACLLLVLGLATSCSEIAKDYRLAKRKAKEFKAFSDRLDRERDRRNQQAAANREREARLEEEHPHGAANFDDLSTPASARLELTPAERAQMRTEELEEQQELEELNRTQ